MKKTNITLSIALAAVFSSSVAFAEVEVTGKIVHESANFTRAGTGIGAASITTQTDNLHGGDLGDLMKSETSARVYFDGDVEKLQEGATYHVELNLMRDTQGVGEYDSNESYTQRDVLREAYVDVETNGYSIRVGKQQVVWGTADGMKLLDAINPTDYSEMAQNQMEDSRVPVFMINAETEATDGGSLQFIVSESKSSHFAGLGRSSASGLSHTNGSQGHAFIMKGVDTITGKVNGFLNVAPALGATATIFDRVAQSPFPYSDLRGQGASTVDNFVDGAVNTGFEQICAGQTNHAVGDAGCLAAAANAVTLDNPNMGTGAGISYGQNVLDATGALDNWDYDKANSAFEYLYNTTFATFDAFVGMTSEYRVDHDITPVLALKYKNSTSDGLNYSFNAIHGNDTNPYVDMHWETQNSVKLVEQLKTEGGGNKTVQLVTTSGDSNNAVGGGVTSGIAVPDADRANLVMTEKLQTITQIGGSFDTAFETATLGPVVIRGEALYQKDVMSPVVIRKATDGISLRNGFLTQAIKMIPGDRLKFVLGADISVLTNMMVSAQFIQDRNLDYVEAGSSYSDTDWKYTADMATMHLTNGLNKAEENKEFYSLFLSKPFGASGEHRWNNILMYEENDGFWNRLDAEFSIDDDTQATVEYNKYWGDANTQFGQLELSSNIQVGVKYSF
jgi:hypothetical protein